MAFVCTVFSDDYEIKMEGDTFNTYNYDSHLSQVLQGNMFTVDGEDYALIQIHGGCDVRGGYTDAICFKIDNGGCCCLKLSDIYGYIDGAMVSTNYDGWNITFDEHDENSLLIDTDIQMGDRVPLRIDEDGNLLSEVSLYILE